MLSLSMPPKLIHTNTLFPCYDVHATVFAWHTGLAPMLGKASILQVVLRTCLWYLTVPDTINAPQESVVVKAGRL